MTKRDSVFVVNLTMCAAAIFLIMATALHAEVFEMVCINDRVPFGRVAVDYYFIVDTTASMVTDRTFIIGNYRALITQSTVDWTEPHSVLRFDRIAGRLVIAPDTNPGNSSWGLTCKNIPARF